MCIIKEKNKKKKSRNVFGGVGTKNRGGWRLDVMKVMKDACHKGRLKT